MEHLLIQEPLVSNTTGKAADRFESTAFLVFLKFSPSAFLKNIQRKRHLSILFLTSFTFPFPQVYRIFRTFAPTKIESYFYINHLAIKRVLCRKMEQSTN